MIAQMKTCAEIDSMPIEELRSQFDAIMGKVVTGYGDDVAVAVQPESSQDPAGQEGARGDDVPA
jgi:hypothetical protein